MRYKLPAIYNNLTHQQRREVRIQYAVEQKNICPFCKNSLDDEPTNEILSKKINWNLFPPNFLKYPIHLQHDHDTGLTESAVHSYCNAVMWQYHEK